MPEPAEASVNIDETPVHCFGRRSATPSIAFSVSHNHYDLANKRGETKRPGDASAKWVVAQFAVVIPSCPPLGSEGSACAARTPRLLRAAINTPPSRFLIGANCTTTAKRLLFSWGFSRVSRQFGQQLLSKLTHGERTSVISPARCLGGTSPSMTISLRRSFERRSPAWTKKSLR